jgi:hypothetical protein
VKVAGNHPVNVSHGSDAHGLGVCSLANAEFRHRQSSKKRLPVWFGFSLSFGVPAVEQPALCAIALLVNVAAIMAVAFGAYALLGMRSKAVRRFTAGTAGKPA